MNELSRKHSLIIRTAIVMMNSQQDKIRFSEGEGLQFHPN